MRAGDRRDVIMLTFRNDPSGQREEAGTQRVAALPRTAHHAVRLQRIHDPIDRGAGKAERGDEIADAGARQPAFQEAEDIHRPVYCRNSMAIDRPGDLVVQHALHGRPAPLPTTLTCAVIEPYNQNRNQPVQI